MSRMATEGFLRLGEPCYVFASSTKWQQRLGGGFPNAPADYFALLHDRNPLKFRLCYARHSDARQYLRTALDKAQYLQYTPQKRTGLSDTEVALFRRMLFGFHDSENPTYCSYYLAAVIYRQRQSRDELTIVIGTVKDDQTCHLIRMFDVPNGLTLRFSREQHKRTQPTATDFVVKNNPENRLTANISEYYDISENLSSYPWTIIDGFSVPNILRRATCRSIPFSDGYLSRNGEWVIPTLKEEGAVYDSIKLL